jgi:hypothetical protein
VLRATLTAVLLLALVAQAASAAQHVTCPMLERAARGAEPGCEHCPPPPPDLTLRSALPDCCALHAAPVRTAVSEPVRVSHPASAVALPAPRAVAAPPSLPELRAALTASRGPAPPPPPRNLPLLS